MGFGFTYDIELNTEQPFIVELDLEERNTQTLSGAIALKLDRSESFKVATVAIHGHIGAMVNSGSADQELVRDDLVQVTVDLIAANDTDGSGTIVLEAGEQYIPFRIDLPSPHELPPTLINKLDTPYIDWKYEIHATLRRDYFFSTTRVVKHDLILRRPIGATSDNELTASMDRPGQYRSKLTTPGRLVLGQDRLLAKAELKARSKEFMIKEVDCAIIQVEDIDYVTKSAPSTEGQTRCIVNSSRLVSSIQVIANDEADMDFGRYKPIEFDLRVDNHQLIPTERGLDWLNISHVLRYTIHFLDVNQPALITELPLFVGNEVISTCQCATVVPKSATGRLLEHLKIHGAEDHCLHHEKETTPDPEP
ncbi:hypothetical protein BGX29_008037 [Mortierella sp. GBA35]|nr:hypothetical protein BGX23_008568 [Mortierella sp. AD031]KAF9097581.1 hypothetical protein BGX29_008037 [Mortierella sp. GBA35]KAG0200531.1 hypothetical protein BGX33_010924 [Mortierella sp. NVP41]